MEYKDFSFVPVSDSGYADFQTLAEHKTNIDNHNYSAATAYLDGLDYVKGARAAFFNTLQSKIRQLQLYFLNEYIAGKEEYYSDTEPTAEFMAAGNYKFWIKPW